MHLRDQPPFSFLPTTRAVETLARWRADGVRNDPVSGRLEEFAQEASTSVLRHASEDACIGLLFHAPNTRDQTLRFFVWIAPPFRANGYATAAARILLEQAWSNGFERVEAAHRMDSPGASQLAERLGLLPEGVQRGAILAEQGRVDIAHWGLLRTDR